MAHSTLGELIKTGKGEILSCTLRSVDPVTTNAEFYNVNFRRAVEKECGILFYEYAGNIYYPYAMEFRLIDNNILFLIKELEIKSFEDLCHVLTSSFKREEGREVSFFAVKYKTLKEPPFCYKIDNFIFSAQDDVREVVEIGAGDE